MNDKWVIIGCGGHARSIADVIVYNDEKADIVFLDEKAQKEETIFGFPVVHDFDVSNERVIVGIGDNLKRIEMSLKYYNNLCNVVSKNAYVSKFARLGRGIFIAHQAHVGVLTSVDDFVVINTAASVDHDCQLKIGSFVGPHATLCGKVMIGKRSFVGGAAVVRDGISVESEITVGAGAVVIKNLIEKGKYVGIPAHKI